MEKAVKLQPYTKNNRKLRNTDSERKSPPQGRAHQFVIQYQVISPGNKLQVAFYRLSRLHLASAYVCAHVHVCMHALTMEKEGRI